MSRLRSCIKCKKEFDSFYTPDPCLGGYLPGIAHACCGHGYEPAAYCCGWNGCKPNQSITAQGAYRKGFWIKRGKEAIDHMKSLGAKIPKML